LTSVALFVDGADALFRHANILLMHDKMQLSVKGLVVERDPRKVSMQLVQADSFVTKFSAERT